MPIPVRVRRERRPEFPTPPGPGVLTPWWLPPDGTDPIRLNPDGEPWISLDSWDGVTGAAPVDVVRDPHPRGGARVRHVQPQPRTIIWPLRFRATTHMDLVRPWREMAAKFAQTRRLGPGTLRIVRPDGTAREIDAYYEAGFRGEDGQGWLEDTAVLQLLCEDPFWRDPTLRSTTRQFADQGSDTDNFYAPFMSLVSGQVIGETTVDNPGDVQAWPEWTITGPASLVTATNQSTDEQFVLDPDWDGDGPLAAGQSVTIVTDPPAVRGPDGQVWTGALNWPQATLWGLVPGRNAVDMQVDGADSGTQITLVWHTRHETP